MVAKAASCEVCCEGTEQKSGTECRQLQEIGVVESESKQARKEAIRRLREINNNNTAAALINNDGEVDEHEQDVDINAPVSGGSKTTSAMSDAPRSGKKVKKFIPATELFCFQYIARESQNFEGDISFRREEQFSSGSEEYLDDKSELVFDGRAKRKNKIQKARIQLKGKHYSNDKLNKNCGRKLYVKSFIQSCKTKHDSVIVEAVAARKQNIEKDLMKRKLIRQGPKYPVFENKPSSHTTNAYPADSRKRGRNQINSQIQSKNTPRPVHRYELTNDRISAEESYLAALVALQHREITPEDYEVLLRLEERVAPKTVAKKTLDSFKTDVFTSGSVAKDCAVCMEKYEIGEKRKHLPCGHIFHGQCIDTWLSNSSMKCPLDGLDVS